MYLNVLLLTFVFELTKTDKEHSLPSTEEKYNLPRPSLTQTLTSHCMSFNCITPIANASRTFWRLETILTQLTYSRHHKKQSDDLDDLQYLWKDPCVVQKVVSHFHVLGVGIISSS